MRKYNSPYHGGYGTCNGFGSVWVDDGVASNSYTGGPPCPNCLTMQDKLAKAMVATPNPPAQQPVPVERPWPYSHHVIMVK
jgi:hypothetical protein